jgi:two-component system, NtrC family, sensor kinase
MKKIIIVLFLILVVSFVFASAESDSLIAKLKSESESEKAVTLLDLAQIYLYRNTDSALEYSKQSLELSRKHKVERTECKALKIIGSAYSQMQEFQEAEEILFEGLQLAIERKFEDIIPEFNFRLGNNYEYSFNYEKALKYYILAEQAWTKSDQLVDVAGINKSIGNIYWQISEFETAKEYYEKSLIISTELDDLHSCASVLNNLGNLYFKTSDYEAALEKYLHALKIREELDDPNLEARSLLNIGNFYIRIEDYNSALGYLLKASDFFESSKDEKMLMQNYNSIGIVYKRSDKHDEAIEFYTKALELATDLNQKSVQGKSLNNIAVLYQEKGETDKSLSYYKQALHFNRETKDKSGEATNLNNIGSLYIVKGEPVKAVEALTKSQKIAEEINDSAILFRIYTGFSDAFYQLEDYRKSLEFYKLQISVRDSLNSVEIEENITEIQTKYDTEKKEKEIEILTKNGEIQNLKLAKQKNRLIIIIFVAVLVIIFAIIIYQVKQKQIQTQKEVQTEIEKLNTELEHRVKDELKKREHQQQQLIQKSKLESIGKLAAGIAHEINQPLGGISMGLENIYFAHTEGRLTEKYLDEKLKHIDGYFERIKQIIDHIRIFSRDQKSVIFEDVDLNQSVKDALSLLQTQFANHNVELNIDLDNNIPQISGNKFKLEQVILNLLTNAKDAVDEKKGDSQYKKKILIRSYTDKNNVYLEIEDNGKGIPTENLKKIFDPFFTTKDPAKGTGLGLSIIYGIIKEMDGEIEAESRVGEFTKFRVVLQRIRI